MMNKKTKNKRAQSAVGKGLSLIVDCLHLLIYSEQVSKQLIVIIQACEYQPNLLRGIPSGYDDRDDAHAMLPENRG